MIVENIICENENILIHYSVTKWTFHSVWTDTFLGKSDIPVMARNLKLCVKAKPSIERIKFNVFIAIV